MLNFKTASLAKLSLVIISAFSLINPAWADQTPETRTSAFEYYDTDGSGASFGQLKAELIEPGRPNDCVRTGYTYDSRGNKLTTTVNSCTGADSISSFATRTSSVSMDTNGQFVTSTTNALAHTETYSTDPRFGLATSQTGPNNLTSTVTLDELGRKVQEKAPDQSKVVTTTYSCQTKAEQNYDSTDITADAQGPAAICNLINYIHPTHGLQVTAVSYSETQRYAPNGVAQGGIKRDYYDVLGRELGSVQIGLDLPNLAAYYVRTVKAYDNQGRHAYTSVVHRLNSAGGLQSITSLRWSVQTFDNFGRPSVTYTPDDAGVEATVLGALPNDGVAIATIANGKVKAHRVIYEDGKITTQQWTSASGWTAIGTEEKNILGQLLHKKDALGNEIAYRYDVQGQLAGTKDGAGNITKLTYDLRGRKTEQVDPDLGTWTYRYDALGQLKVQKDAKNSEQTMSYDVLGRVTQKATAEFTANYVYDCNRATAIGDSSTFLGKGSLCEENTTLGYSKLIAFDSLGRVIHTRTNLGTASGNRTYDARQTYDDSYGRLARTTYPTGIKTEPQYSANGAVIGLNRTDGTPQSLWKATGLDQYGNLQQWQLGNGLITTEYRDVTGRLTGKNTGSIAVPTSIQQLNYSYTQAGDLATRQDVTQSLLETFTHDSLHRLRMWDRQSPYQPNGNYSVSYTYNGIGNLIHRSDRGTLNYAGTRPHALTELSRPAYGGAAAQSTTFQYDANGSVIEVWKNGAFVRGHDWTSFHQPAAINWNSSDKKRVEWLYDASFSRIQETKMGYSSSSGWVIQQKIFKLHPDNKNGLFFEQHIDYSKKDANNQTLVENRHFISTPVGVVGVLVSQGEIGSALNTTNVKSQYWHTDHLGSLTALTDETGQVVERFQYDPFGERLTADGLLMTASRYTDRGFTGHEHVDELGLIHMNGRLFDPMTGRFLSADPLIQSPDELQSYNRYGYCWNNPMGCTDPSGYFNLGSVVSKIVGLVVAAVVLVVTKNPILAGAAYGFVSGMANGGRFWESMAGGVISGAAAGATAGIGNTFAGTAAQQSALNSQTALTQFMAGQNIVLPVATVGTTGLTASQLAVKALMHGISGGFFSIAGGGSFRGGFASGFVGGMTGPYSDSWFPGANVTAFMQRWVVTAIAGGTAARLAGDKFANGAKTAAFVYLFNDAFHRLEDKLLLDRQIRPLNGRGLTTNEIAHARKTFSDSMDYDVVNIINEKYIFTQGDDFAVTPNGNIYWPAACADVTVCKGGMFKDLFIHEMTHVYQYQHGVNVLMQGLLLQGLKYGSATLYDPYSFTYEANKSFNSYNIEQQGDYAVGISNGKYKNIIPR